MRTVLRVFVLAIAAMAVVAMCADSAFAQRGGRGGQGGRGGFGGGFGGGGTTGLLQDENVRKELDLVDEQVTKLTDIGNKLREELDAQRQGFDFGSLQGLSEEERNAKFAEMRAKTEKITAEFQKEIDAVLLPHQRERLKQLAVQSQMRFGADRALSAGTLAEELGITEEQKEKLAAKQQEIQAGLQEKIAKLQAEARDELFSVLTSEQQAKLKAMIGKPFTFTGGAGGFGGGGFGGQGGRGGDAGGGRGRGRGDGGTRLQRPANGD